MSSSIGLYAVLSLLFVILSGFAALIKKYWTATFLGFISIFLDLIIQREGFIMSSSIGLYAVLSLLFVILSGFAVLIKKYWAAAFLGFISIFWDLLIFWVS
ncbi:MAG: hypothetical protein IPN70_03420 [Candidatus Moraniibacteriota bacterium]|nr:MAG: hypothetical protein IPN70_03420 [Candidatus Moranbacteria bacterium]